MRYFRAENVTQPIADVIFTKTRVICGCVWGAAAVDDPASLAALDAMIVKQQNGLVEISEEAYLAETQKKTRDLIRPIDSGSEAIKPLPSPEPAARPAPRVEVVSELVKLGDSPPPVTIKKRS